MNEIHFRLTKMVRCLRTIRCSIRVIIGTAGRLVYCSAWFADAADFLVVIRITANAVQATSAWAAAGEFWSGSAVTKLA